MQLSARVDYRNSIKVMMKAWYIVQSYLLSKEAEIIETERETYREHCWYSAVVSVPLRPLWQVLCFFSTAKDLISLKLTRLREAQHWKVREYNAN